MSEIRLSILIPVYNVEKYIYTCLKSVYAQDISEDDYEVIVINDGTPDESMKFVLGFASKHKNLKIIEQENMGLSVARNSGLKIAKGEYIWFVDSDDSIFEDCLSEIIRMLDIYKCDLFISPLFTIDEETGRTDERGISNYLKNQQFSGLDILSSNNISSVPVQIYFINRSFLENNLLMFYPGIYHEDKEFVPRMLYFARSVYICEKPFYKYLLRTNGSITSSRCIRNIEDQMKICHLIKKFKQTTVIDKKEKRIYSLLEFTSLFYLISELNFVNNKQHVKKFLIKNIRHIRYKSFFSFFSMDLRMTFFGLLAFIHPRLLMIYHRVR